MAKLGWEWTLATESVRATLETPANVESLFLDERLVSRSAAGGKPDGHAVPLPGVDVRAHFNAATRECVLYVNGAPVAPTRVTSKGGASFAAVLIALLVGGPILLGIFTVLAVYGGRKYMEATKVSQETVALSQKYSAPNGLLVAHYPADFAAQARGDSLQVSRSGLRDDSIILAGIKVPVSDDPAELSRVALKPILDAFAAKGGTKTAHEGAGSCLGRPGYTTDGTARVDLEDVVTWSCTFVERGHGYVVFISVNATFDEDMPLLKRIVDATDIVGGTPTTAAAAATAAKAP